jgi:hypothetical protein
VEDLSILAQGWSVVVERTLIRDKRGEPVPEQLRGAFVESPRREGVDGGNDDFVPVEVDDYGEGIAVIGLLVERLPDGRCAVFIPTSPVTTVGNVLIVSPDKMRLLDAGISDAISAVSQWGVDTTRIYAGAERHAELN